jgi:signal transduction histidine kinase
MGDNYQRSSQHEAYLNEMVKAESTKYYFLEGGGEMGRLTRAYDWASTSIGPVSEWPQTLRAAVSILLHTDFPMFLWWGEDMIQFYNNAYRPSLGDNGKHPLALGQKARECWPEIWDVIYPLIQEVRTTGKSFFLEDQLISIFRNGRIEEVYWTFSYSAVIGEEGNVDGVLVVCTETTQKVKTLKRIENSEQNLKNVILQAPVAICILKGPNFIVEIANDKILEIWGKERAQTLNKPMFEGLPEARSQGVEILLENVFRTGEPYIEYERAIRLLRNGRLETKYIDFVYEAFREVDGRISGVMALAIETTEKVLARHKIEEVVAERTESLRKSNAELSQFAYITSHDLQEPARKISTFVEMLGKSLGAHIDDRSRGYLTKIDNASQRMLRLIRDVLTISQLSQTAGQLERVDLNKTLEDVKNDYELLIEQKGCVIESDILPVVSAIPVQMSQLFGNLVSNALKFSSKNGHACLIIRCEVVSPSTVEDIPNLKKAEAYYKLSFTDNGIGFEQGNATQIFDIFKRLHNRTDYQGTGIGLAMCKKIAENHGGHIYATSSLGAGATFVVILPKMDK